MKRKKILTILQKDRGIKRQSKLHLSLARALSLSLSLSLSFWFVLAQSSTVASF